MLEPPQDKTTWTEQREEASLLPGVMEFLEEVEAEGIKEDGEDDWGKPLAIKLEGQDEEIDLLKGLAVQARKPGGVLAEAVNQGPKPTIVHYHRNPKKMI